MQVLSPGKYVVKIGGEEKEIIISLGLKTELYKIISKAQIKAAAVAGKIYMDPDLAGRIKAATENVKKLEAGEASPEEIEVAQMALDLLYEEALKDVEQKQSKTLEESILKRIDITEKVLAEAISCMLSTRDEYGKIVEKLDPEKILWDPVYGEAQEELIELLYAVTEYITSALKKISGISQMVGEVTKEKP